ncbi:MAG: hydrolase [Candidatus Nomurabacteria bacterium]|jgi:nicotinamidase-related amidase|nr:hydrolase [Candidatus Nomurabacteria bacterium]
MTSLPKRNGETDWLITPENAALLVIDYQPTQIKSVQSRDHDELTKNIVMTAKLARAFDLPIVLSTVNVATTMNQETIAPLKEVLSDLPSYDRTSINAWEDREFVEAVRATGRKKLLIAALWTEACLTFPTLDALHEGYEVYPIVDAVAGTSLEAHDAALRRVEQAGAQPISFAQLACELQRDWNRRDTEPAFLDIMLEAGKFGYK